LKKLTTVHRYIFFILTGLLIQVPEAKAQLFNYYWAQSFNSVSTMLSGAVVAGDGGSSSIYYNPANISEAGNNSNLSLSAVMFSWRMYNLQNLLGDGTHPGTMNFAVQPRFITYVYNPPKSKFTLGGTVFTRFHERTEINYTLQKQIDILKGHPGDEQYNAYFDFRNRYDDTWVGIAGAYDFSPDLHVGMSFFVSSVAMQYLRDIENSAVTLEDSSIFSAIYNTRQMINFNDFRVIFKFGASYRIRRWRFGINITAPSFTVLSMSKKIVHSQSQANITYKGKPLPDYVLFLEQKNNEIQSRSKLPLSIAWGLVYDFPHATSRIYLSVEHFFPLKPYLTLESFAHPVTTAEKLKHQWMSVVSGSRSLTNVAVGYSWKNPKNVGFMLGFRTDFNYLKDYDLGKYRDYLRFPNTMANNYHITGGAEFSVLGQKITTGVEVTFSHTKNQKQIANFTNPMEYNAVDRIPLQGVLEHTASLRYFSINLYLSAELNFGKHKTP
jgi:hypothetical protein